MTSKAKAKGNGYERELCAFLIETFGGNWMRVPNSGAFTGGFNAHRKQQMTQNQIQSFRGDIIPDDSMPNIVIECKFYADFTFHNLVKQRVPQLESWIEQTLDAVDEGNTWFLCMKFNRKGTYVLFHKDLLDKVKLNNYTVYFDYIFTDLESFFTENKEVIKNLCKPVD